MGRISSLLIFLDILQHLAQHLSVYVNIRTSQVSTTVLLHLDLEDEQLFVGCHIEEHVTSFCTGM